MIASVVVDISSDSVDKTYDYVVPPCFETSIAIGQRVLVPFGPQKLLGFVVELKEESAFTKLREIEDILDLIPCLNQELVSLAKNMHEYYFCLYIKCLLTMIPAALRVRYEKRFKALSKEELTLDLQVLFNKKNEYTYQSKDKGYLPLLQEELKKGHIELENIISDKGSIKEAKMIHLNEEYHARLNPSQEEIITYLEDLDRDISKSEFVSLFSQGRLSTLVKNGVLSEYDQEVFRHFDEGKEYQDKHVSFNDAQRSVYKGIKSYLGSYETILLHGITGSGKTEIYLRLIEDVIKEHKTAILLVPEISLTPQIVARFKARFKEDVAVLHSGLSIGEKYDEWRRIMRKEVHIVVGARSAIFAPLENLGIIIIDEEHETSYKQDSAPRYDARMIARIRSRNHSCPCLLGSATPSIESYYWATHGSYKLFTLNVRANQKQMPSIQIVDMVKEIKAGNHSLFSRELKRLIEDRLAKKEQTILLMNRRGFASFVMCRDCGEVIKCPHCEVSLTYHKTDNMLKCHYCGYQIHNVEKCPSCGSSKVRFVGGGTQRVVEEIEKEFKTARVLRMDMDNTRNKGAHEKIIEAFMKEEADILVGTQMVAKGLDFPKVSLVGILNSDLALKYPSYQSPALAYNLFVQVSGRAGRHDTDGMVVLQAYDTTHYAILNASTGNYERFFKEELSYRKLGNYPPFKKMVDLTLIGKNYQKAFQEASRLCQLIQGKTKVDVLGPAEDFIVKIKDLYRFKITIKFEKDQMINALLEELDVYYENSKEYDLIINRM